MKTTFKDFLGAKDVKWWDGLVRTFTRRTSTGGTLTMNKIGAMCDVLEAYGDGTDYSSTALLNALSAITTANVTLLFQPGTWNITENVTIPATIAVCLPQGAKFSITAGKTLTVNGMILAGSYVIFDGTGTVGGSPVLMFRDPAWFSGTVTDSTTPTWKTPRTSTLEADTINQTTAAGTVMNNLKCDTIAEKTAAAGVTIDGVKLKDSEPYCDVINEKTAAAGVTVDGCLIKDGNAGLSDGTNSIKIKIINIGDWNMDTAMTVSVAHGLTLANIRSVSAMIRSDDGTTFHQSSGYNAAIATNDIEMNSINATTITLQRKAGSVFDSVSFQSTPYNRGWITIIYIV